MATPQRIQATTLPASGAPGIDPAAFFESAHSAYLAAEANRGLNEAHFAIGGQHIQLRFAGRAWLPQFTAALAHRAVNPGLHSGASPGFHSGVNPGFHSGVNPGFHSGVQPAAPPDLTICIWDDASTGVSMPPPPWSVEDYAPRGEIAAFSTQRYRAGYQLEAGLLSLLDAERGLALIWTADAARLPRYELTFPARSILYWWAHFRGQQLTHAGAVGHNGGGVLLVGKGGSGKSTTALACLQAGLDYAGDDYVLVSHQPQPRAYSVYCSGKLHASHIDRLPAYVPLIHNREHLGPEKALLYLNDSHAGRLAAHVPLSAIVLPKVTTAARTTYQRVSTVESLAALAPSTLRQLPGAGHADYQRMSRLARALPAYALALGVDIEEIPAVVKRLIAEACAEASSR